MDPIGAILMAGDKVNNTKSNLLGIGYQEYQNWRSRKWSEKMYQRQYDDMLKFWNMENQYNTPANQMARFKEAGLNPNLMFGKGTPGLAGSVGKPDTQRPEFGAAPIAKNASFLSQFVDYEMKNAQIDNVEANADVQREQAAYIAAQRGMVQLETGAFDWTLEGRKQDVFKKRAETKVILDRNEREALQNVWSIREAARRIINMRAEESRVKADTRRINATIDNLAKDTQLKKLEIEFRKIGLSWGDPLPARVLGRALQSTGLDYNPRPWDEAMKNRKPLLQENTLKRWWQRK